MEPSVSKQPPDENACEDLLLKIPCKLASRVRLYAQENKTTVVNVVIEALDTFMRDQKNRF